MAVRIGGPLMWSCGEGCPFILVDRDAELHGEAIKSIGAGPQDRGVPAALSGSQLEHDRTP